MKRIPVAVVGATGLAGQQFLTALHSHPRFEVTRVVGSKRSANKTLENALRDEKGASRWFGQHPLAQHLKTLTVEDSAYFEPDGVSLVFSAVESAPAREVEARLAQKIPVVSTSSAFRYEADVPIFLPGVNLDHIQLLKVQQKRRGWKGFVTPIPNCTTTGLAISLKPLVDNFGVKNVIMTSMQACSGAGRSPGVVGIDIIDNIVPFIPKEEEKVERETKKILGTLQNDQIVPHAISVSATCTRVPVLEGHTESIFVSLEKKASVDEVCQAMRSFGESFQKLELPSSPRQLIVVHDDPYRPQPRLDRDMDGGMVTVVGRVREDHCLQNGIKYMLVSHNTKMGAAKGAILIAELLDKQGILAGDL